MLGRLLGGIGDWIAPRPDSQREFEYLLRSGQADKAIALLRRYSSALSRSPESGSRSPHSTRSSNYDDVSLHGDNGSSLDSDAEEEEDGIDVNRLEEDSGLAPLHFAAAIGSIDLVMELLLRGADVESKSSPGGNTALHLAAMNSHYNIIEVLLRSDANPAVPNDEGLIPVELAKEAAVKDVLLRRRGSLRLDKELLVFGDVVSDSSVSTPSSVISSLNVSEHNMPSHHKSGVELTSDAIQHISSVAPQSGSLSTGSSATPISAASSSATPLPESTDNGIEEVVNKVASVVATETEIANERMQILLAGVTQAAIETAWCYKDPPDEAENKRGIFKACQEKSNPRLLDDITRLCSSDPGLARCRACEMLNLAMDGWTPLHAAARWGNVPAINLLLRGFSKSNSDSEGVDLSNTPYPRDAADPWALDLQGRTPLHHAAERGFLQACRVLRTAMQRPRRLPSIATVRPPHAEIMLVENERLIPGCDPVGADAPIDLTGTTPLGWVTRRGAKVLDADVNPTSDGNAVVKAAASAATPGAKRSVPIDIQAANPLEVEFFSPGDASVLPKTPSAFRCGSVKRKVATPGTRRSVMFSPSPIQSTNDNKDESKHLDDALGLNKLKIISDINRGMLRGSGDDGLGVVYGFSEASGWRNTMEDRIIAKISLCDEEDDREDFVKLFRDFDDDFLLSALQNELDMRHWSLFAVFDGHGGDFSSSFASVTLTDVMIELANRKLELFLQNVSKNTSHLNHSLTSFYEDLMKEAFIQTDALLSAQPRMTIKLTAKGNFQMRDHSGSTCILVLLTPSHIIVSNVGDSRAVMGIKTADGSLSTKPLSFDHKPMNSSEQERIERAGCSIHHVSGSVYEVACEKSKQRLRMSRSIGDFYLKQSRQTGEAVQSAGSSALPPLLPPQDQAVSCVPDVVILQRDANESFIILACDGIWDVVSNEEAVQFVGDFASKSQQNHTGSAVAVPSISELTGDRVAACCDELLLQCLQRGSRDNMSAMMLALPGCADAAPWMAMQSSENDVNNSIAISNSFSSLSLSSPPIATATSPNSSSAHNRSAVGAGTPRGALNSSIASASTYMESPDVNTSGASIRIMDVSNEEEGDDLDGSLVQSSAVKLARQRLFDTKADA